MTLERHKSHLIPDVECTPEGIFVTDRDGSFALRGKRRFVDSGVLCGSICLKLSVCFSLNLFGSRLNGLCRHMLSPRFMCCYY